MDFFAYLHFFNFFIYLYLAIYVYIKNQKALVNKICAGFLVSFSIWSFSNSFIHNPFTKKKVAVLFDKFSSLGWASFCVFFLWFILAFTRKKNILKKKWLYLLFAGLPLIFIYKHWDNTLFPVLFKEVYGWGTKASQSIWVYLLYVYLLTFMGAALFILAHFIKTTQNSVQKKQAKIIFITAMIGVVLGTTTDLIFPLFDLRTIPDIASAFLIPWAIGVVYAMGRYKFLTITPATAASNIISTMYDCLILLDMERNIVSVNNATLELLGYEEKELKGAAVRILFTEEEEVKNGVGEKFHKEENIKNKDVILRTKDGRDIPVLFSSSVLRDDAGNKGGIVCIARDISERKKLEEEVLRSKKLESIGKLAGGIAHDFNNLLNIIIGYISLALDELSPGDKGYKYWLEVENASLMAAELISKFVTFSQGGRMKREKVLLSHILKEVIKTESALQGPNISYNIDIADDLMPVAGDQKQVSLLLQNLFLNALEAVSEARNISISVQARNTTVFPQNEFQLKPGDYVRVIIEDNGTGITTENLEKVFDPYFSTKEEMTQKGMGLGLTICYSIVKGHDGYITVDSQQGKGTTVTFYLPVFI
jgi:PAS domain S-box-containing protein